MKILSFNAGYFIGFQSMLDYIRRPHRTVLAGRKDEKRNIEALAGMVEKEQPDLVFMAEVDQGSLRTRTSSQVDAVSDALPDQYTVYGAEKYSPGGIGSKLPFFRKMGNGMAVKNGAAESHYFDSGFKSLLFEAEINGADVFGVHLPLLKSTRSRQLESLKNRVKQSDRPIVCGDFNNQTGPGEVSILTDETGLKMVSPGKTYPAHRPRHAFDFFLVPEGMEAEAEVIDNSFSDHLPVKLELE